MMNQHLWTQVLKNLALAKIEAGDAKGALTMLREQAKKVPTPGILYEKGIKSKPFGQ